MLQLMNNPVVCMVTILAGGVSTWALYHYHGWRFAMPVLIAWGVSWIVCGIAIAYRARRGHRRVR